MAIWILPAIIVFFVLRLAVRRGVVRPNTINSESKLTSHNYALDLRNSSPLAILKRFQTGISYCTVAARNQNNPQGDSK